MEALYLYCYNVRAATFHTRHTLGAYFVVYTMSYPKLRCIYHTHDARLNRIQNTTHSIRDG